MSLRQQFRSAGCCAIALLAPFLGGSTERWAMGIILILLAILVGTDPPRSPMPGGFMCATFLLLCLASTAFLPASWFGNAVWRQELNRSGVALAPMVSPQPWISLECLVLMLAGVVWICWLCSQTWGAEERRLLAGVFVCGAAALSVISLVSFYCQKPVPFWHSERGFGPFPNRNQSGNFFAISGILALGCICENFRRKKILASLFVVAALLICCGLATSYSRAALILFFVGSAAWIICLGFISGSKKTAGICASLLVALAAVFLLFGGATLERFQGQEKMTLGFRWLIYKDAFSLIHSSPWCGVGLGNFEGIFALFRRASAMPSRILHPESDWLWLSAEMGWLAVALVLSSLGILLGKVFPLERGTNRQLRLAGAVAALVFVVHGVVDVPGHRLGSALPGLFMLGLAFNNGAFVREKRWVPFCFRIAASVLGITGAIWLCAAWQGSPMPGTIGVAAMTQHAQLMNAEGRYSVATEEMTKAIEWAPLDWQLYFIRGMAEVCDGNWPRAYDDFRRLNILESTSPLVTFEEGTIWLGSRPSYAIPAWSETLRRCAPQEAAHYYDDMLGDASGIPELRRALHSLVKGRFELEMVYLGHAPPEEAKAAIRSILQKDEDLRSLTDEMKAAFFRIWVINDGDDLVRRFWIQPAWQHVAWRPVAEYLASRGDLQGACKAALQFMPQPAFPKTTIPGGIEELHHRLLLHPDDFLAGHALIVELMNEKNDVMAMKVVHDFTSRPESPKYFHFLEAEIAFRTGDFSVAWDALQKYEPVAG